ncbi:MerR family DNA-binding transcriptional regulator [Microbispora hainanensis]|uniref:MerR family transcriptional regulator n=1 Tax=Microbispora hainanensis TaxID=568844 RepID=A0A544Z3R3_9ACTN|nr:MerR family transcriptional regulator [Microbispora hainanensis]TQS23694.1 MerR family transcriptional regulator [Microbispora hainanensis]
MDTQARSKPAHPEPEEGLSIAEAARRTGLSVHTLRYYERAGLVVTPVGRTTGGPRRYHGVDLKWIVICTKMRATGMPYGLAPPPHAAGPSRIPCTRQTAAPPPAQRAGRKRRSLGPSGDEAATPVPRVST